MKIILYYAPSFWFKTYKKVLDEVPDLEMEKTIEKAVVAETPFGYLNEWKMHVAGESLAKVFKEL